MIRKLRNGLNSILVYNVLAHWQFLYLLDKKIRVKILRFAGASIGENCFIGYGCYFDNNLKDLTIGDDVLIAPKVTFLFHKRNLSNYDQTQKQNTVPHIHLKTVIENNVSIGIGATILPGVHIGKGAIIGAKAVVTKDVPAWSIAIGFPAKVVKQVPEHYIP